MLHYRSRKKPMNLSVIVARFQIDELHEGHQYIIREAARRGDAILVVLGSTMLQSTANNPLPAHVRAAMVMEFFAVNDINGIVKVLPDTPSDLIWSQKLDALIEEAMDEFGIPDAVLFHARDSFAAHYSGRFPLVEVPQHKYFTATARRQEICENPGIISSSDFRRGMIYARQLGFPMVISTVDIFVEKTIWDGDQWRTALLVITKPNSAGWFAPGGFADNKTYSNDTIGLEEMFGVPAGTDEFDALREAYEESGVIAYNAQYIGSVQQNDSRYRPERDKIRTRVFIADWREGEPEGRDDAETAQWIWVDEIRLNDFHSAHHNILRMYFDYRGLDLPE